MQNRSIERAAIVLCLAGCCVFSQAALAQGGRGVGGSSGRSTMVIDDGQGVRVLSYSTPHVRLALQPDYVVRDVDPMTELLGLSEAQRQTVIALIEDYLAAFSELKARDFADLDDGEASEVRGQRRTGRAGGPEGRDGPQRNAGGGQTGPDGATRNAIRNVILEELRAQGFEFDSYDDLPFRPAISVRATIEQTGDGPPQPNLTVGVSFDAGDDSVSEDVRAKLQAAADRMVPRITEHVQKQMLERMTAQAAAGGVPTDLNDRWREVEHTRARIDELLSRKRVLRERLEGDIKALLNEDQLASWGMVDRWLTRAKTMPLGTLDGESTDLLTITANLVLTDDERLLIADLLAEYEARLHELLVRRNDLLETSNAEIDRALYEGRGRRALSITDSVANARVRVRDLNEQYSSLIADSLGASRGGALAEAFLADAFPSVYRPTIAARAFESAAALDDLTDDVRIAIRDLAVVHVEQVARVNDAIRRKIRQHQPNESRAEIESIVTMLGEDVGNAVEAPGPIVAEAFKQRIDLDARLMRQLYAMLTEAERANLPAIPGEDALKPITAEVEHRGDGF